MLKKRKRILALDLLRGFFLFVIIVDHINRFPNGFDLITGRGIIWVSAAEGFITISGILIGYIYGPRMLYSATKVTERLWKRAFKIYVCVLALSAFFMAYSVLIAQVSKQSLDFAVIYNGNVFGLILDSLTLQYVYGWGEFLSHYVFFLLISPIVLWLVTRKNKIYLLLLLTCSTALWLIAFHPFDARSRYDFAASWQILFVLGTVIGYYLPQITHKIKTILRPHEIKTCKTALYAIAVTIILVSSYLTWGNRLLYETIPTLTTSLQPLQANWDTFFSQTAFAALVDKTSIGPLRIICGSIVFWALYIFFNDYNSRLPALVRNFLKILGEKSLFVYGLQSILVFFIGLYVSTTSSGREILVLNTGVTMLALFFVYLITKNTSNFKSSYDRLVNILYIKLIQRK